jgi:hypothetical protein
MSKLETDGIIRENAFEGIPSLYAIRAMHSCNAHEVYRVCQVSQECVDLRALLKAIYSDTTCLMPIS